MKPLTVFIFSYNRGRWLNNCVRSAFRCVPDCQLTVIDDCSDDPETLAVLQQIDEVPHVNVIRSNQGGQRYLGGLYGNMQAALDLTDAEWGFILQDDMQFVRKMSAGDVVRVDQFFDRFKNTALLYSSFLKFENRGRDESKLAIDVSFPVYWYRSSSPYFQKDGKGFFADVGIFNFRRLKNKSWKWVDDRFENNRRYYELFSGIGIDPWPTFMFLPFPLTTKFRKLTFVQRASQLVLRHGFYPYQQLEGGGLSAFMTRDLAVLPQADTFLRSPGAPSGAFSFSDAHRRSKYLARLELIERWIRG